MLHFGKIISKPVGKSREWGSEGHRLIRMLRLRSCFNDGGGKRDLHEGGGRESTSSLDLEFTGIEWEEGESRDMCDKMAMDLQPSAPFASSSSFPSPHVMESQQTLEEIQFAYQKLQNMHPEPLSGTIAPPPPSGLASRVSLWNTTTTHNGDVLSARPWSSCGTTTLSGSGYDRPRSVGTYFSPNKIAHRGGTLSTAPNSASHQDGPCLTSLQELLQKTTNAKKAASKPREPNCQAVDPSSGRLLNKLRNLDEILRSLDDSLLCRKFTSLTNKMATPQSEDTQTPSNVANLFDRGQIPTSFAPIVNRTKDLTPTITPTLGIMSQVGSRHATTLERQWAESDANWLGGESVGAIPDPHIFATSLATRVGKQDIPLLLSRYSSAKNSTPSSTHSQEGPIKEVLSRVDFLEQQIAHSMECLRGKLQRRVRFFLFFFFHTCVWICSLYYAIVILCFLIITLFRSITMICGTDSVLRNISLFIHILNVKNGPENIVNPT